MRLQQCDYCSKKCDHHVWALDRLHGILACEEHWATAKRDANAWLRENKHVRMKDFLAVYPEMKTMTFNVPRSNGSITAGGNLSEEPWQFFAMVDEEWRFRVLFTEPSGEIMNKYMRMTDLDKSGVPPETIKLWVTALSDFYNDDFIAQMAARDKGTEKKKEEHPNIHHTIVNGVEGRVFLP
jgi:hypothetical protein